MRRRARRRCGIREQLAAAMTRLSVEASTKSKTPLGCAELNGVLSSVRVGKEGDVSALLA